MAVDLRRVPFNLINKVHLVRSTKEQLREIVFTVTIRHERKLTDLLSTNEAISNNFKTSNDPMPKGLSWGGQRVVA